MAVRYCTASWWSIFFRQWSRQPRVQERSASLARRYRPGLPEGLSTWSEQLVNSFSLHGRNQPEQTIVNRIDGDQMSMHCRAVFAH